LASMIIASLLASLVRSARRSHSSIHIHSHSGGSCRLFPTWFTAARPSLYSSSFCQASALVSMVRCCQAVSLGIRGSLLPGRHWITCCCQASVWYPWFTAARQSLWAYMVHYTARRSLCNLLLPGISFGICGSLLPGCHCVTC